MKAAAALVAFAPRKKKKKNCASLLWCWGGTKVVFSGCGRRIFDFLRGNTFYPLVFVRLRRAEEQRGHFSSFFFVF